MGVKNIFTRQLILGAIFLTILVVLAYFWPRPQDSSSLLYQSKQWQLSIKGTYLSADVANTEQEKITGLSNRPSLGSNEGMLFIYDPPAQPSFWMKDMLFPIDIMWIDSRKAVIGIEHSVSPETYPMSFQPPAPVKYVLEVRAGFSKERGISPGDVASF